MVRVPFLNLNACGHPGLMRLVFAVACAGVVFIPLGADAGEPSGLLPPSDVQVFQVGYGETGVVRVTWRNAESYERLELRVDKLLVAGPIDGTAERVEVDSSTGEREFSLRAVAGDRVSEEIRVRFTVLAESPLTDPVRNVTCRLAPERGGSLRITWEPGTDPWTLGEVRNVRDGGILAVFTGEVEEVEVPLGGAPAGEVAVAFADASGYFSEPSILSCPEIRPPFRRGDCDADGGVQLTDAIVLLNHLFQGGRRWPCDDACDADDSGRVELTDGLAILLYLYQGGTPPPPPGPETCGVDPTADNLGGVCSCP